MQGGADSTVYDSGIARRPSIMILSRRISLASLGLLALWTPAAGCQADGPRAEATEGARDDRPLAEARTLGGSRVKLLVPSGVPVDPAWQKLAVDLDREADILARRIPYDQAAPLRIRLETDHVEQGRHTGKVGEAVVGGGGELEESADLHLVFDPRDGFAYRFALAERLLARAGYEPRLPLWLRRGAALWLEGGAGDWYGRPYRDWLPLLAAAEVFPQARELLAAEDPGRNASVPLWAPIAAAVIERLPGSTIGEKAGHLPDEARLAAILAEIARSANGAAIARHLGEARRRPLPAKFLRGVSLAMSNRLEGGYHAPAVGEQLAALQRLGADAVSLMPFAFQRDPRSPALSFVARSPAGETDIGLIHAARLARSRGLRVLYKPHVWVGHDAWSGQIEMTSERDWQDWFRAYRLYAVHHALLAGWAGADLYSVGCELSKTTPREAEWRALIRAVRTFFPGPVTYSANWYGDLEGIRFWSDLDAVGVDAYFPLSPSPQASERDLARGAAEVAARLRAVARRTGLPLLLTEVGFAARQAAWVEPHTEGGEYSEEDQARAYRALFRALGRPSWLAGAFVWKAFSAPGGPPRGIGPRADFRFQGRQAEAVIRDYYRSP
jgi:hypothetical protein